MTGQTVIAGVDDRFDWSRLRRQEPSARDVAAAEANELARLVAAQTIVLEGDAVIAEFEERHRAIASTLWSEDALEGYQQHSSLGAYVLARVAVGWVPAGHTGHRHEPLRPEAVIQALVGQGVDETTARSVVDDWPGVAAGVRPQAKGLSLSVLSGLAERSLMRAERADALSQVAFSPRCLHRLAAICGLLASVRLIFAWVPSPILGPEVSVALAAIALGHPTRVTTLLPGTPTSNWARCLNEIATAIAALERGEAPELPDDPELFRMPVDGVPLPRSMSGTQEEDILEIVEERSLATDSTESTLGYAPLHSRTVPPSWDGTATPFDQDTLEAWRAALSAVAGLAARRGSLLGLKLPPPLPTVPTVPIPPDVYSLRSALEEIGGRDRLLAAVASPGITDSPLEALFPGIRSVLRAVARAAEGVSPADEAVRQAGDFGWVLARARGLAKIVTGDVEAALEALSVLPEPLAPEVRWARERQLRFQGRAIEPAAVAEARPAAGLLVGDLAQQLARTLAGTVPSETL